MCHPSEESFCWSNADNWTNFSLYHTQNLIYFVRFRFLNITKMNSSYSVHFVVDDVNFGWNWRQTLFASNTCWFRIFIRSSGCLCQPFMRIYNIFSLNHLSYANTGFLWFYFRLVRTVCAFCGVKLNTSNRAMTTFFGEIVFHFVVCTFYTFSYSHYAH